MKKRAVGLFVLLLAAIFVFMSFTSATATCSVMSRTSCTTNGGHAVMGLYSVSNSHVQNASYTDYSYVVCCTGFGSGDTSCATGSSVPINKVVGISSGTNAHAEVTGDTNYTNKICYSGLSCVSTTSACPSDHSLNLFNLSQNSNSHVDSNSTAGFGVHICCGLTSGSGGTGTVLPCTITSATWNPTSVSTGGRAGMEITGTNCSDATINYTIYDANGNQVGSAVTGHPNATWNVPNVVSGNSETFTFNATAVAGGSSHASGTLTVTQSTSLTTAQCSDYTTSATCTADLAGANNTDPQLAVLSSESGFQSASCQWDPSTGTCALAGVFGSSTPTYCNGTSCLYFSGCDNGYTLCESINSTEKNYYCYPGSICPTNSSGVVEAPTSDQTCGWLQGCSSTFCQQGDQDTCVRAINGNSGATCAITPASQGGGGLCNATTPAPGVCGDGTINPGEVCDGSNLNGNTCESLGFAGGSLSCSSCQFNTSLCTGNSGTCGDGTINPGEACDGSNLNGNTCESLGFAGGSLSCSSCQFDTNSCVDHHSVDSNDCLNGACYQNPGSLTLSGGCGDGYNLCNYNGAGFCYPGNCTNIGASNFGDNSLLCRPANSTYSGDTCSTAACLASTKSNPLKGSCSGDAFCLAGVCYSPTAYSGTCVVQSSTNGSCANGGVITLNLTATWTGDQNRVPPSCTSGTKSVECPAQAQLPFFTWWNLAATVVVLALIYIVIMISLKKKKTTKSKAAKPRRKTTKKKK